MLAAKCLSLSYDQCPKPVSMGGEAGGPSWLIDCTWGTISTGPFCGQVRPLYLLANSMCLGSVALNVLSVHVFKNRHQRLVWAVFSHCSVRYLCVCRLNQDALWVKLWQTQAY